MKTNWKDRANDGACERAANEHHARMRMQQKAAEGTKAGALHKLKAAGYDAQWTPDGLTVTGDGWQAFYADAGQDSNTYTGSVPPEVDDLAVWDDAATRAND